MNEPAARRLAIWCCACRAEIMARLTSGAECYPHRRDLAMVPRWKCDGCGNHVGCHHKAGEDRTRPLGVIATPEIKAARQHLHALIDPLWKSKRITRLSLYGMIGRSIGKPYHTAEIRSLEEARAIYRIVQKIARDLDASAREPRPEHSE